MTPAGLALVVGLSAAAATVPWWRIVAPSGAGRRSLGRSPRAPGSSPAAPLDAVLLLDLVDVAIAAGASVPRALSAVGTAVGGEQGDALVRGGTALLLGAPWRAAWVGAVGMLGEVVDGLEASWTTGSAPGPVLRARAEQLRRDRRTRARTTAGVLGVHLVLPLGLCFLPAFVLLGLVPLILSLAGDLLR